MHVLIRPAVFSYVPLAEPSHFLRDEREILSVESIDTTCAIWAVIRCYGSIRNPLSKEESDIVCGRILKEICQR